MVRPSRGARLRDTPTAAVAGLANPASGGRTRGPARPDCAGRRSAWSGAWALRGAVVTGRTPR